MHVLYLMPAEGFGGAERQGVIHIEGLRALGHRVTAIVGRSAPMTRRLSGGWNSEDTIWFDSFPPPRAAAAGVLTHCQYGLSWSQSVRRNAREVRNIVNGRDIQVVVANRTYAWVIAALTELRSGLPYVIRAGSRPRVEWMSGILRIARVLQLEPSLFFSNCRAVERCFEPHLRCPRVILPNAVDLREFGPRDFRLSCQQLGLDPLRPRVALALRPSHEKGIELLCQVASLVREVRSDIEFVIAGDYWERHLCQRVVRDRDLADTIRFVGHIEQVAELYGASHLVLLPSRSNSIEGSPNALLEAMACSKALVATSVGGIPELVEHGCEGILVRDRDAQAMADAIMELLQDKCARQAMGCAGRRKAGTQHAAPSIVQRLANVLEGQFIGNTTSGATPCE